MEYTSIGQLYRREIFLCKLFGGFMFSSKRKALSVSYISLVLAGRLLLLHSGADLMEFFARDKSLSKRTLANLNLYFRVFVIVAIPIIIALLVQGVRHHNILTLVLQKRILLHNHVDVHMERHLSRKNPLSRTGRAGKTSLKSDFFWRMLCLRLILATALRLVSQVALLLTIDPATRAQEMARLEALLWIILDQIGKNLLLFGAEFFQLRAFEIIYLAIIDSMTEMLRRLNKLNRLKCKSHNSKSRSDQNQSSYSTELLYQIRDVLIVLKRVGDIPFTMLYVIDIGTVIGTIGLSLALLSAESYWWALYTSTGTAITMIEMLADRLAFLRLHRQAELLSDAYLLRLVNHPYEQAHRVQNVANYRLAGYIRQALPSSWMNYDVRSLLLALLSAIAFMVGLQKIAETSFGSEKS